ncbi:MAG: creatininase family protein, partial [Gemmatimonadetes bacterium]|nr:creatininase family protein [Gemmatimonadota bacterium]
MKLVVCTLVALVSSGVLSAQEAPLPPVRKVRNYLPHMTVPEVQDLLTRSDMVIIPVASLEQHGLHLPIGTDYLNGVERAKLIAQRVDVLVAPILLPGQSPYHMGFEGTVTLPSVLIQEVYVEAAKSLMRHGFKRFLILNSHGGNAAITKFIVDRIKEMIKYKGYQVAPAELEEITVEAPGPGEVQVRIQASGVCHTDLHYKLGNVGDDFPYLLGHEGAGVVEEVGSEVRRYPLGARVMALLAGGGYAEQVVVHEGSVLPIPDGMSFEEAAAVPETFLTCYLNLFRIGAVREGQWVLVHGGGSGIGTSAIRLLRAAGVHVIVTCGSLEKVERCRELGADAALNYREGPFAPEVLELMKRVTIIPSHRMTLFGPRITIFTKDGKSFTKQATGREFM